MKLKLNLKLNLNVPTPSLLTYSWNYGSLLLYFFFLQIITGIMLSFFYTSNINLAFDSVIFLSRNINNGIMFRFIHSNGPSMIFFFMFAHLFKNLYMSSYKFKFLWLSGMMMFLLCMMISFMGYVLPWGQMSFWGATVITNLISVLPFYGNFLCFWIWGNFSVGEATLIRFFSLHFLLGYSMIMLICLHIFLLHFKGSSNSINMMLSMDKISFLNLFIIKDLILMIFITMVFCFMIFFMPYFLNDEENFIPANPMISPLHIKPEWYFLFSYCILRSIPNKLGGVMGLLFSILIFFFLIFLKKKYKTMKFFFMFSYKIYLLMHMIIIMSWLGMNSVMEPFISLGKIYSFMFFLLFFFL